MLLWGLSCTALHLKALCQGWSTSGSRYDDWMKLPVCKADGWMITEPHPYQGEADDDQTIAPRFNDSRTLKPLRAGAL